MRMKTILLVAVVILCVIAIIEARKTKRRRVVSGHGKKGNNNHHGTGNGKHRVRKGGKAKAAAAIVGGVAAGAAVAEATKASKPGGDKAAGDKGGAGNGKKGGGPGGSASGKLPHLRGVNRAGTEFACIKGDGIFKEGPVDDDSIVTMKKWNINAVRVPLNEDCWLGKNVPHPEHGGKAYQDAIVEFVHRLRKHELYVIVDLHWTEGLYQGEGQGSCTEVPAKCQKPMPDKENAPKFWEEVAEAFKDDPDGVIFDLFNEPFPDMKLKNKAEAWECWQKGGESCKNQFSFEVAGMEDLIKAVRGKGAKNLLMLGGLTWANDLDGWLDHVPKDDKNIAASMHSYDDNACSDENCWDKGIGKIAKAGYKVIVGEIGDHKCKCDYIKKIMPYLDKHKISYLAWTWNKWDCGSGPALIKEYDGTPTDFGIGFKEHLAQPSK